MKPHHLSLRPRERSLTAFAVVLLTVSVGRCTTMYTPPQDAIIYDPISLTNVTLRTATDAIDHAFMMRVGTSIRTCKVFTLHPSCTNVNVSLELSHWSLRDALSILNEAYGIEAAELDAHGLSILLASPEHIPMRSRLYDVVPSLFPGEHKGPADVLPFFQQFGVEFPTGSSATLLPGSGKIMVHTRDSCFPMFEKTLGYLNVVPFGVETIVQLFRVGDGDLVTEAMSDPTPTNVHAVISESELLLSMSNVSASGHAASNVLHASGSQVTSAETFVNHGCITISPSVSPGGRLIALPLHATFGVSLRDRGFVDYSIDTQLMLYDNGTRVLWLHPPAIDSEEQDVLCLRVSVRVIAPDGQPLD